MCRFILLGALFLVAPGVSANPLDEIRTLGNCAECVIHDQDFSQARLLGIDLTDTDVSDVSFARAAMPVAVLNGARLSGVSFEGANLRGASFVGARLSAVSFLGADLTGAVFEGAVLIDTDLSVAHLCKTQMPDDSMANAACADD